MKRHLTLSKFSANFV